MIGVLGVLGVLLLAGCGPAGPAGEDHATELLTGAGGWSMLLDPEASWVDDPLHLPGVDLASLPVRPPTGGWERLGSGPAQPAGDALGEGRSVQVPSTVEAYLWDEVGDTTGVSWWWRSIAGRDPGDGRVLLRVGAVRLRAEVFLDETLVGYDAVGNSPFTVDLTDHMRPGETQRLAFRVTDPGGNFDWIDHTAHRWGDQPIPPSHGFGGVTGHVTLQQVGPLWVEDVFVENTPSLDQVRLHVTLENSLDAPRQVILNPTILADGGEDASPSAGERVGALELVAQPGTTVVELEIDLPDWVEAWTPDTPHLYRVMLFGEFRDPDGTRRGLAGPLPQVTRDDENRPIAVGPGTVFGVRWFEATGQGEDAVFRLNGERVVLRSAISWGFWPVNGSVPSPELARRQVVVARSLGLNMLNHHRCIPDPLLLDTSDRMGLLAYTEPGGYWCQEGDELAFALAREKWLRMVARDRNHPSVVMRNMINEAKQPPGVRGRRDLADAQALDPSTLMTWTSAWSETDEPELALHVRPGVDGLHTEHWYDEHHAPGPGLWRDEFWSGPDDHLRFTDRREDIVFWGEEGAIGTPPRLERIAHDIDRGQLGWDGRAYLDWRAGWKRDMDEGGLSPYFPDLDVLTRSLGSLAHDYQARVIQNVRATDLTDGYVINGWECEPQENHSGMVDLWRHSKADPSILAAANAPLALAVKLRRRVAHTGRRVGAVTTPAAVVADVMLLNEVGLEGQQRLVLEVVDTGGEVLWSREQQVLVEGGERFGQALLVDQQVLIEGGPGHYELRASLWPAGGEDVQEPVARGVDTLFLTRWRGMSLPEGGAVVDGLGRVTRFLEQGLGGEVTPLDEVPVGAVPAWLLVTDVDPLPMGAPDEGVLRTGPDGEPGLSGEYFAGEQFDDVGYARVDAAIEMAFGDDGPAPGVPGGVYSIRWQGQLVPPESGPYRFHLLSAGGVRLWVDGALVLDRWESHRPDLNTGARIALEAGRAVSFRLEHVHREGGTRIRLGWTRPSDSAAARDVATRVAGLVRDDGVTAVVLGHADRWALLLEEEQLLEYEGRMTMDRYWLGGGFFNRPHPIFTGLPSGGAMGFEYQELVHYGMATYGLRLAGEEALVGCITDHRPEVATAVGVLHPGAGRLLLCTLDIPGVLLEESGAVEVPRTLLSNMVRWAAAPP